MSRIETAPAATPSALPVDQPTRPGPLGRLAGVAYRRRLRVVLAWVGALVLTAGLSAAFAGRFTAD